MEEDKKLIFKNFYFLQNCGQLYIISKRNVDEFLKFYIDPEDNTANHNYYRNKPRIGCALFWDGAEIFISVSVIFPLHCVGNRFLPAYPSCHVWERFLRQAVIELDRDPDDLKSQCMLKLIAEYDFYRFIQNKEK